VSLLICTKLMMKKASQYIQKNKETVRGNYG
jgi:hypothetical protein